MKKKMIALLMCGVICLQTPAGSLSAETVSENSAGVAVSGNETAAEEPETENEPEPEAFLAEEAVSDNGLGGRVMGYHDIDVAPPEIVKPDRSADEYSVEYADTVPSRYRSDNVDTNGDGIGDTSYLPALRDQGNWGTCWAFSALGACEASLIKNGLADRTSVSFSPLHLSYYFYQKGENVGDLLGNAAGDYNRTRNSSYLNAGGNGYLTMWQLAAWAGPANESAFAYSTATPTLLLANNSQAVYGNNAFHVQNAYIINTDDRASMKRMIMQCGGLGISYYASTTLEEARAYDNMAARNGSVNDEGSYYCYDKDSTNHAVMVVGWDDNYSASNFVRTPAGNGAWLIRNSWGAEDSYLSQSGYFWISYYDTSLSAAAFAYDCEAADNYDNIYQHDGASGAASLRASVAANVFTAGNRGGIDEQLKAVSIGVDDENVNYTVDIYTYEGNPVVNASNVTNGLKVSSQSGTFQYSGYHTVKLKTPVLLSAGQRYAVVFRFTNKSPYINYDMATDYNWVYFNTRQQPGQSFLRQSGITMMDCASQGKNSGNLRIKAFTDSEAGGSLQGVSLDKGSLKMNSGDAVQINAAIQGGSKNNRIKWTSSNNAVATVVNGRVVAKGYGSAVITATTMNGKAASCSVNVVTTDFAKPLLDNVKPSAYNKISVNWVKANNATGCVIYRSNKKNGKYTAVKTVSNASSTSWTDKKVSCGDTYYYKVKYFYNKGGKKVYSGFSPAVKVKAAPAAPVITKAAGESKKSSLKWKKVAGANGYVVYRSANPSSKGKAVATVAKKNTYTDKKLKTGTTYYYTVKAYRLVKGKKVYSDYSERVAVYVK